MPGPEEPVGRYSLGYEFAREDEAQNHAAELARRFTGEELPG